MGYLVCGRLGLALERPTTVPTATAAPTIRLTLITNERVRRCFAGAITAPAGREAAMPMPFSYGAAAVPTGAGVPPFCCCVACGALDGGRLLEAGAASGSGIAFPVSGFCDPD
jgi:hypothetical protein